MPKAKQYLDIDVLTAARRRIRHAFDAYDTVAVCFSGGKDSTAALWLAKEVAEERGLGKVNVVFRDEELIPDAVIEHVQSVMSLPWVRPHYFTVPLKSSKFILGKSYQYTQWGPGRPWVREKPANAISLPVGDTRTFDQYTIDAFTAERFKGSVMFVTGIRADESLTRLRSVLNKLNMPWVTNTDTSAANVRLGKVIYDWTENDVLKFLHESGAPLCQWYCWQHWAGCGLRVSTPIHSEQAKRLSKVKELDPEFYDRILKVFPEVEAQARYWGELDKEALRRQYGESLEGVQAYLDEFLVDEAQLAMAQKRFDQACVFHQKSPEAYPVRHILDHFIGGGYKRSVMAMKVK
jgi:predicted phosphoadenosine phosphosulfate sulfurtransferase